MGPLRFQSVTAAAGLPSAAPSTRGRPACSPRRRAPARTGPARASVPWCLERLPSPVLLVEGNWEWAESTCGIAQRCQPSARMDGRSAVSANGRGGDTRTARFSPTRSHGDVVSIVGNGSVHDVGSLRPGSRHYSPDGLECRMSQLGNCSLSLCTPASVTCVLFSESDVRFVRWLSNSRLASVTCPPSRESRFKFV